MKQAHGGIGASSHMACLLFTAEIGAKPALVAYRGSGPALNDLVGGHVDFMCEQSVSVAESVLAGSVKAFAVSACKRLETLPDVPTASEAGINYEMSVWAGLFAPKGVSPEIIARLSDALDRALDEDVVRERIAQLGGSIPAKDERNPAAFDRFVRSEIARWSPILAAAGTAEMRVVRHMKLAQGVTYEIAAHHHQHGKRQDHAEHGGDDRGQFMGIQPLLQRPYHRIPDLILICPAPCAQTIQ